MAKEKAVRGNTIPAGGPTVTTESGQAAALLPDTFTLRRMTEVLQDSSEQNVIKMNRVELTPGQSVQAKINNVGLGESLEIYVSGEIKLKNAKTDATQDVNLSPEFPFNILSLIQTQFNGQTVINSLSGYELLSVMAKRKKGVYSGRLDAAGAAGKTPGQTARVPAPIAWVKSKDENGELKAGPGLTGFDKVTVAKNQTATLEFGFYLELPYTLRNDLLLGLIPLQNNSVYAMVRLDCPLLLGSTPDFPLYVSGQVPAELTVEEGTKIWADNHYNFWTIPAPNDPRLYAYLCSHSYMLLSQAANALPAVGPSALQYAMPNNYYLISLLLTLRDADKKLAVVEKTVENPFLNYNGTAQVDRRGIMTRIARQNLYYEGSPVGLGQLLWDATDVQYQTNSSNTTKWLNMYQANNPTFVADIEQAFNGPGEYAVLREQVVPANVRIV